jgi:hypothetical protein
MPRNPSSDELDGAVFVHRRQTLRVRGGRRLLRMLPGDLRRPFLRRIEHYRPDGVLQRLNEALSNYIHARRLGVDFDVVQAPNGSLALAIALFRSYPLVVNLHCPPLFEFAYDGRSRAWRARVADALDRLTAVRADLLTSPSELMVRALQERRWLGAHKPWVVPNATEPGPRSSVPSVQETRPVILSVGKLRPIKAPEVLVEAAALLRSRVEGVEVVFVGGTLGPHDGRPYGDWVAERARRRDPEPVRLLFLRRPRGCALRPPGGLHHSGRSDGNCWAIGTPVRSCRPAMRRRSRSPCCPTSTAPRPLPRRGNERGPRLRPTTPRSGSHGSERQPTSRPSPDGEPVTCGPWRMGGSNVSGSQFGDDRGSRV